MVLLLPAFAVASNLVLADATPASCTPDPTDVRIEIKIADPRVDTTKTGAQLQTMHFDGAVSSNRRFTEWTGLTVGGIAVDSEIRIANDTANGKVCAWPSAVTITLSTAPTVYVVTDHGDCQKAAGLKHEMEHVAIDRQIIQRYAQIFRRRIASMADAIELDSTASDKDLKTQRRRIEEKIDAMIAVVSDNLNADRDMEQQAFDSPEEYTRMSNACHQVQMGPQ